MIQVGRSRLQCSVAHSWLHTDTKHTCTQQLKQTVKEMWQKTYRGQDIDYIQIKADADGARSYNYR